MTRYLIQRVLHAFVVIWLVVTLVFFLLRAVPGDPFAAMLADVDPDGRRSAQGKMGLRPAGLRPVLPLDGAICCRVIWAIPSMAATCPSAASSARRSPRTLSLAFLSFTIALSISLAAGIISAIRRYSLLDHGVTITAFMGLSMPDFWLGILLIIVFAVKLRWLPAIGYKPISDGFWPWLSHLILPAIAAGTAFAAIITRMIRSAMLEVLQRTTSRWREPRA